MHKPGPPMDLSNMRRQGVHHLIAYCHNDACRHQGVIDVPKYPGDTLVSWFQGGPDQMRNSTRWRTWQQRSAS
jgi:hypothetical protein